MEIALATAQQAGMVQTWLTALAAALPDLHLYTNSPAVTPDSVVGDFTEPLGGWYAPIPVLPGDVYVDAPTQTLRFRFNSAQFNWTSAAVLHGAETIVGIFLTTHAGAYIGAAPLPVPVTLATILDSLVVDVSGVNFPLSPLP